MSNSCCVIRAPCRLTPTRRGSLSFARRRWAESRDCADQQGRVAQTTDFAPCDCIVAKLDLTGVCEDPCVRAFNELAHRHLSRGCFLHRQVNMSSIEVE
jgi:hypothetical protein